MAVASLEGWDGTRALRNLLPVIAQPRIRRLTGSRTTCFGQWSYFIFYVFACISSAVPRFNRGLLSNPLAFPYIISAAMASKGRAFYHSRIFNLSYFHPLSYFQYAFPATDYMLCRKAPTGHQHIFLLSTTLIFRPVESTSRCWSRSITFQAY